jgi:hypothetical protein
MKTDYRSTEWQTAAQAYLQRLGAAEYKQQIAYWKKSHKSTCNFRFSPSAYLCEMCDLLGQNDEEAFKARKMLEGYASALKV